MLNKEELYRAIKKLLETQHLAVLATQGDEYPYCTLVGYVQSEDGKEILFATIRETRKYNNLKKNSHVSLLITSQTNKVSDFKEAEALTILGHAEELGHDAHTQAIARYLKKHPYLEDFIKTPDCALIRVVVVKYILVQNFQNVSEYEF